MRYLYDPGYDIHSKYYGMLKKYQNFIDISRFSEI